MPAPVVTTEEGQVKGTSGRDFLGGNYYSFLGIPYAKAPIGELRFKAPVPIEPWKGIRNATQEGPECPARHMIFLTPVGKEDNCLNLNVFTKNLSNEPNSLKPVMVWIHGGGFVCGSNKTEMYSPDYLITEDIVLVAINYRVGILGFLSLEDPSLDIPGNAGLKDMVLGLQWVQRNIKNFGGDPNKVTIFGESAGGAAVHYLLMSPLSKGLFHKAIAQSGSSLNNWSRGCSNGQIIAKNLKFEETNEKKILEHLRSLPAHTLVNAQRKTLDPFEPSVVRPFGPVVEQKWSKTPFITEEPINIIKSGKFHQVPLIMGYTSREGMLFQALKLLATGVSNEVNFEREIFYDLNVQPGSKESKEIAAKIEDLYYKDKRQTEETRDKLYLLKTDNMFLYGIHESVEQQKLISKAPIYFYKMTLDTKRNVMKTICMTKHIYVLMFLYFIISKLGSGIIRNFLLRLTSWISQKEDKGTCHADDLGFLFRTFANANVKPESVDGIYIRRFVKLWTNFAKTGNPTPNKDDSLLNIQWKPVTKEKNLLLNIGNDLKMEVDPDLDRISFWKEISNKYKRT